MLGAAQLWAAAARCPRFSLGGNPGVYRCLKLGISPAARRNYRIQAQSAAARRARAPAQLHHPGLSVRRPPRRPVTPAIRVHHDYRASDTVIQSESEGRVGGQPASTSPGAGCPQTATVTVTEARRPGRRRARGDQLQTKRPSGRPRPARAGPGPVETMPSDPAWQTLLERPVRRRLPPAAGPGPPAGGRRSGGDSDQPARRAWLSFRVTSPPGPARQPSRRVWRTVRGTSR